MRYKKQKYSSKHRTVNRKTLWFINKLNQFQVASGDVCQINAVVRGFLESLENVFESRDCTFRHSCLHKSLDYSLI